MHHGQQDHAEVLLHLRVLEKLVQDDLGFSAALQFDHDAHAIAITLIANIGNVVNDLVVHQLRHALNQPFLADLIGNLGDNDGLAILAESLNRRLGAHRETSAPRLVRFKNPTLTMNDSGRREIWPLHEPQDFRK